MSNQEQINIKESKVEQSAVKKIIKYKWIITGICVSLIAAIIFTCFYTSFEKEAKLKIKDDIYNQIESIDNMNFMYRNCYVLYRDLYNKQNGTNESFLDVYLKPAKDCEVAQNDDFIETVQKIYDYGYLYNEEGRGNVDTEAIGTEYFQEITQTVSEEGMQEIVEISNFLKDYFAETENDFGLLNSTYDYIIEDTQTGEYITNLPSTNIDLNEQYLYVSFLFDENGNVSVDGEVQGSDATQIRKNANEAIRNTLGNLVANRNHYTEFQKYLQVQMPVNCRVTFCIKTSDFATAFEEYDAYRLTSCGGIYMMILLMVALVAFFIPAKFVEKPWNNLKICRPAIEILITFGCIVTTWGSFVVELVRWVQSGEGAYQINYMLPHAVAVVIVYIINLIVMAAIFFCGWYMGICVREMRENGFKAYFKKRCAFYQIFPYCKRKIKGIYDTVSHFDVTQNAKKTILKIVLVNAVIVFIISSLWVGGFMIAVVYSIVLYIILRKYISDLQKNYGVLLGAVNKIAEGDLNVAITEDLGVFEPFKPQVIRIQRGFKKAVDEEVKSQRMKSELITNVSHDLKTPLTAIITYVNLLKEENVTEEQRKEYLDTLERKSLRLKVLIEDLFEVSKANSQNMTLNYMDVDIINLVKQVSFEMADKLEASRLDVRMNLPEQKVLISVDSQKTYRIYENLFGNIAKYALTGTRVYVDAILHEDTIEITLKNITAEEIFVSAEELTERFVRGDVSRNTEGSGLGLAIAKSLTELQGGNLQIQVDGDLFKVTTVWKRK